MNNAIDYNTQNIRLLKRFPMIEKTCINQYIFIVASLSPARNQTAHFLFVPSVKQLFALLDRRYCVVFVRLNNTSISVISITRGKQTLPKSIAEKAPLCCPRCRLLEL